MQSRYFKMSMLILLWGVLLVCYQSNLFFWGWYDDAILSVFTKPILFGKCFLNAPGSDLAFINYSLIYLSVALGKMHFVSNGYGFVLFCTTVIWVTGACLVLYMLSKKLNYFYKFILFSSSFICLLPHLFFLNYTANSVLLAGIGSVLMFLALRSEKNTQVLLIFGLISVFAGLLMRYQAAFVALALVSVCLLEVKEVFKKRNLFSLNVIGLLVILALPLLINRFSDRLERAKIESFNQYNFTANDSYLLKQTKSDSSVKLIQEVITSWSVLDSVICKEGNLKQVTFSQPLQLEAIRNIPRKGQIAWKSLSLFNHFTPSFNLRLTAILYLILLIWILVNYSQWSVTLRRRVFKATALFKWLILFLLLFLKLEYRLANPLLFTFSLVLFYSVCKEENNLQALSKIKRVDLSTIMVSILLLSMYTFAISYIDKRKELAYTTELMAELNQQLKGSTIVFDSNSLATAGGSPSFNTFNTTQTNSFITTGEYWTYFYQNFSSYFEKRCGHSDLKTVYTCLAADTSTLFLYNEYKVSITEQYLLKYYGLKIKFTPIAQQPEILREGHYCYFHFPFFFRLYRANLCL